MNELSPFTYYIEVARPIHILTFCDIIYTYKLLLHI